MPFIQQFVIAYGMALLIGSFVMTRGGDGFMTILLTYGLFGLPFALAAAGLARLLERTALGWSAGFLSMLVLMAALYFIAPNKQNFAAAMVFIAPLALLMGAIWSFLSWHQRGAA